MAAIITFNGTRDRLLTLLRQVPRVLSGVGGDASGAANGLALRVGAVLADHNVEAFKARSRGEADAAGQRWEPLSAWTVMGRRLGAEDRIALKERTSKLGKAEAAIQKDVYKTFKAKHVGKPRTPAQTLRDLVDVLEKKHLAAMVASGLSPDAAAAKIRSTARKTLTSLSTAQSFNAVRRAFGADVIKTRMELLGFRQVDILRDTSRLMNSIGPVIAPGPITVGTNVEYAKYHHSKLPRKKRPDGRDKLPRRKIVWDAEDIPAVCWDAMLTAAVRGLVKDFNGLLGVSA